MNAGSDPLARSVDDEVSRLGYDKIDILKLSFSSVDLLRTFLEGLGDNFGIVRRPN